MEIKQLGPQDYVVRLSRGEEIAASLLEAAERLSLKSASVTGLGAVSEAVLGVLKGDTKTFAPNRFAGDYELASLNGNLTQLDGRPYAHLHAVIGDERGHAFGGHLQRAVVSATAELFLRAYDAKIGRRFDADAGINLMVL